LNSPSLTNITTLQVMPAGCTNVIWFWKMFVGSEQLEVKGFNLMQISTSGQLLGQFVEFNSIAWGTDTGELSIVSALPLPLETSWLTLIDIFVSRLFLL
jgi:hypothetical protein